MGALPFKNAAFIVRDEVVLMLENAGVHDTAQAGSWLFDLKELIAHLHTNKTRPCQMSSLT